MKLSYLSRAYPDTRCTRRSPTRRSGPTRSRPHSDSSACSASRSTTRPPRGGSRSSSALVVTVPTALTGLIDWLSITWGSPVWRTATVHMFAMLTATLFFLLAAIFGHGGYVDGEVTTGSLLLTLVGFGTLTLGGWLGGTIVFVHGMRVLNLIEEPRHGRPRRADAREGVGCRRVSPARARADGWWSAV